MALEQLSLLSSRRNWPVRVNEGGDESHFEPARREGACPIVRSDCHPLFAKAREGWGTHCMVLPGEGWVPRPTRLCDRFRFRHAAKRLNGAGLVRFDSEDSRQVGHLKQVLHPLAGINQFQLPAMIAHGGVSFDELSKS